MLIFVIQLYVFDCIDMYWNKKKKKKKKDYSSGHDSSKNIMAARERGLFSFYLYRKL